MKRWMGLILIVPSLLLGGCLLRDKKEDRTPAGWQVIWKDQGTITTGLHDKAQLYALFDAAMERSIQEMQAQHSLDPNFVRARLLKYDTVYTLIDNFYFKVPDPGSVVDFPGTAYASGMTLNRSEIWVAFYNRDTVGGVPDAALIPPNTLPWTIKIGPTTGLYYWGEEHPGDQYPALGYEIGHFFGF